MDWRGERARSVVTHLLDVLKVATTHPQLAVEANRRQQRFEGGRRQVATARLAARAKAGTLHCTLPHDTHAVVLLHGKVAAQVRVLVGRVVYGEREDVSRTSR